MIEHSLTYVRTNLEKIVKAGLAVRITRHGQTVGYYNPVKSVNEAGTLVEAPKADNSGVPEGYDPSW